MKSKAGPVLGTATRPIVLVGLALLAGPASTAAAPPVGEDPRVAAIRQMLQRDIAERSPEARFRVAFVDLNADGREDAVVYGPYGPSLSCGTGGCGISIYERRGEAFRLKSSTSIGHLPVGLLRSSHHGWRT